MAQNRKQFDDKKPAAALSQSIAPQPAPPGGPAAVALTKEHKAEFRAQRKLKEMDAMIHNVLDQKLMPGYLNNEKLNKFRKRLLITPSFCADPNLVSEQAYNAMKNFMIQTAQERYSLGNGLTFNLVMIRHSGLSQLPQPGEDDKLSWPAENPTHHVFAVTTGSSVKKWNESQPSMKIETDRYLMNDEGIFLAKFKKDANPADVKSYEKNPKLVARTLEDLVRLKLNQYDSYAIVPKKFLEELPEAIRPKNLKEEKLGDITFCLISSTGYRDLLNISSAYSSSSKRVDVNSPEFKQALRDQANVSEGGDFICPISDDVMKDPVRIKGDTNNHAYERNEIQAWLLAKKTSPLTRKDFSEAADINSLLEDAKDIAQGIQDYYNRNPWKRPYIPA